MIGSQIIFTEFNEMKVVSQEFIVYLLVEFKKAKKKKGIANYGATEKLSFNIRDWMWVSFSAFN